MKLKGKSLILTAMLAVTGLFGATAAAVNNQINEEPIVEKVDATGSKTMYLDLNGYSSLSNCYLYMKGINDWPGVHISNISNYGTISAKYYDSGSSTYTTKSFYKFDINTSATEIALTHSSESGYHNNKWDITDAKSTAWNLVQYKSWGESYNYNQQHIHKIEIVDNGSTTYEYNPAEWGAYHIPTHAGGAGLTFVGWYIDGDTSSTKFDDNGEYGMSTSDIDDLNFTAVYSTEEYTVTFDKQDGSGGDSSVEVPYGGSMPTITAPTLSGYTFDGYYASTGGSGTKYYNANGTSAHDWDIEGDETIYANWYRNAGFYVVEYNTSTSTYGSIDGAFAPDPTPVTGNAYSWSGLSLSASKTYRVVYYSAGSTTPQNNHEWVGQYSNVVTMASDGYETFTPKANGTYKVFYRDNGYGQAYSFAINKDVSISCYKIKDGSTTSMGDALTGNSDISLSTTLGSTYTAIDGYTITGYFTDTSCSTQISPSTYYPTGNISVYCRYSKNDTFKISIDGGTTWLSTTTSSMSGYQIQLVPISDLDVRSDEVVLAFKFTDSSTTTPIAHSKITFQGNNYNSSTGGVNVSFEDKIYFKVTNEGYFECYIPGASGRTLKVNHLAGGSTPYALKSYQGSSKDLISTGHVYIRSGEVLQAGSSGHYYNITGITTAKSSETGFTISDGAVTCTVTGAYYIHLTSADESNYDYIYYIRDEQESAAYYARMFNTAVGGICDNSGSTDFDDLIDAWQLNASENAATIFDELHEDSKAYLISKSTDSSSDILACKAKYDYILGKYGYGSDTKSTTKLADFIGRTPTKSAMRNFTIDNIFGSEDSVSTIIIIIASSIALLSVTALSILVIKKKRREEYR